jgi:NAD(P)H-flavin reductase
MTLPDQIQHSHMAHKPKELLAPVQAEIIDIKKETSDVSTYTIRFCDDTVARNYHFEPGQFNMIYVPGYGEAAISISSDPDKPETISHSIRFVGNVTNAISRMKIGDKMGIRGPFGRPWPIKDYVGAEVYIATGGIGLAPLRPTIYHIINHRADYGQVTVLYGARTPSDLLYPEEFDEWRNSDIIVTPTVDRAEKTWKGQVGVVPILFYNLWITHGENCLLLSCGPEIMMRFVAFEGLARRIPKDRIYLSLERNMKCGQGLCGHCQLGPTFICKHGPVYSFDELEPYINVENY